MMIILAFLIGLDDLEELSRVVLLGAFAVTVQMERVIRRLDRRPSES